MAWRAIFVWAFVPFALAHADSFEDGDRAGFALLGWTPKHGSYDLDRAARLLRGADIALVGNVDFGAGGKPALSVVANLVEGQTHEHICQLWFRDPGQRHLPFAIAWREGRFALVDAGGAVHERCGNHPWTLNVKAGASPGALFLYRPTSTLVRFAMGAPLDPGGSAAGAPGWPTVVFAGAKVPVTAKIAAGARASGFKAALPGAARANVWSRNLALVEASAPPYRRLFPELKENSARDRLGPDLPVIATFAFGEPEANQARAALVAKKKRAKPVPMAKPPATRAYPAPVNKRQLRDFEDRDDDLVGEAREAGGERAKPKRRKKSAP